MADLPICHGLNGTTKVALKCDATGNIRNAQGSTTSTTNSTTTPLGAGATFTGAWESINGYVTVTIIGTADVAGTLWADFSTDGVTLSRGVRLSNGQDGNFGIHSLIKVAEYFRVRVVNGATPQTSMDVQTLLFGGPMIAQPTSRAKQVVNDYSDVLNVRVLNDLILDEASSQNSDRYSLHFGGYNPAVAAGTEEDLWFNGGKRTYLTAAATVRIKAGGDAADTAAGANAQKITVFGLDENWNLAQEDIVTNGALASLSTTTTFIRLYRARVKEVGTYGLNNKAAIAVETTAGTLLGSIEADWGESRWGSYTVPTGYTGYIKHVQFDSDSTKVSRGIVISRPNADDVTTPFEPHIHVAETNISGEAQINLTSYLGPFPARTDLYLAGVGGAGGNSISGAMCLIFTRDNV